MSKNNIKLPKKDYKGHLSIEKAKINENIDMFMCPVCQNSMYLRDCKSLTCLKKHCFDISKKGYVNLLLNTVKSQYDQRLFKSRNIICKNSFFHPLIERISDLIEQ